MGNRYRGIAQLVEQWSPKPRAEGSSPSAPAKGMREKPQTCKISKFVAFPLLKVKGGAWLCDTKLSC